MPHCGLRLGAAAGNAWQQVADQVGWVTDMAKLVLFGVLAVAAVWWIVRRALPSGASMRKGSAKPQVKRGSGTIPA